MNKKVSLLLLAFLLQVSGAFAQLGQSLPAIPVKKLDGSTVSSSSFSNNGKPIILTFWATWNVPSKADLNAIATVYESWQQQTGVKLIAISIDDERSSHQVLPYVESTAWPFEVYIDEVGDLKNALNVGSVPHTFVLNGYGKLINQQIGEQNGNTGPLFQMVQAASVGLVISGGGLTLVETGGVTRTGNLATGKTAFAQNEIGSAPHAIAKVNDGLFGNANSWVAGSPDSFVGVVLGSAPVSVDRIAFGRDNVPGGATDRTLGLYTLEFTTNPDPMSNAATWTTLGTLDYQSAGGTNLPHPSWRHEFSFTPVSATGFRIRTSGGTEGRCIDELELYAEGYALSGGGIRLVTEYGSIAPNNLALGKIAFAKDEIGIAPHAIAKVNDGLYGNAQSWIAGSANSFVGINFGSGLVGINRVAFGRGNNDLFFDRIFGTYTLQFTTTPNPTAATTDENWTTIGTIRYDFPGGPNFRGPRHRHEFTFDPVLATGFRLQTLTATSGNIAIDELELYGPGSTDLEMWRHRYLGSTTNSGPATNLADPDGDGLSNLLEYAFGLDPLSPSVLPTMSFGSGIIGYSANGIPGVTYGAEISTDLANWTAVTDRGTGRGHVFTLSTTAETKRFLRLVVAPSIFPAPTLTSISVTPSSAASFLGTTQTFIATGIYSNVATQDLTAQVTWSSSAKASISNAPGSQGLATALETGSATITASFGGMTSNATLTITNTHPSNNETNGGDELDYVALVGSLGFSVGTGASSPLILAQVVESGVTESPEASPLITCQIGYGPAGTNPTTQAGWIWVNAIYDQQLGSNDQYKATFTAPVPGLYHYAARFSRDGTNWTYADGNGAGSNAGLTFSADELPLMTVTP
jgi:thiol-disulfide isomerase/thioredoxin